MTKGGGELDFRVLGPLAVLRGGTPVTLPFGRPRALLGLLLTCAGETVTTDRLLDELWRGEPPPSAGHALQVYVSNLRKVLEPDRGRGVAAGVLCTSGRGYLLAVTPGRYDRHRFETLTAAGRAALGEGRAADAWDLLSEALGLWRGPALADLVDEPFAAAEATRLEELRLVAGEGRIEAGLALGRHRELVGEIDSLAARHPFREHVWAQLIIALYRSGRQADALRAYQRLRETLATELGLEPSPPLRELEAAVLRHDPQLAAPAWAGPPATPVAEPAALAPNPASAPASGSAPPTLAAAPRRPPPGSGEPIDEMRVVTALFLDLVGSTTLAELLEPEEYALVVSGAVERMTTGVEAMGGVVASRMGDGIMALFGAQVTHEDDSERALRSALAVVEEIDAYGHEVARSWDVEPLRARAALDCGPVLVAGGDSQVLGDPLNTAARLQGAAPVGGVLCSRAVRDVVGSLFDWSQTELFTLKGKGEPTEAAAALAPRAVPGKARGIEGRPVPLVGREAEMAGALRSVDAVTEGTGGILVLRGEPGTGKSRILAELRQRFEDRRGEGLRSLWLEGRCLSWGEGLSYWPFREMLREWLGASPTSPGLRTRVALRRKVDELFGPGAAGPNGPDVSVFLAGLLGLPLDGDGARRVAALAPESLRHATFEALRALVARLADDGPVVVAVDDVHWADATSLQLVEHLLPVTDAAAVLVVLAMRPEPPHGSWAVRERALRDWAHRTRDVALEPLADGAAAVMLEELLASGILPEATAAELLDAAGGNPLFIEELVRSLLDTGALRPDGEGWRFDPRVPVVIPRSVENVLAARIDRLPPAGRAVLGVAAVLGRQFDAALLAEVSDAGTDVDRCVAELVILGLLEQARRWPTLEYRFRHVLAQEAAYRRLVADRKRALHRRAAMALEKEFVHPTAEGHGVLAFHYTQAGEPADALTHHRLAADAARDAYALDEAARHYSAALGLLEALPVDVARAERPGLHLWRGHVWYRLAHEGASDELRTALGQARDAGDTATELQALEDLALCEGLLEGRDVGLARVTEALSVAIRAGDDEAEVSFRNRLTVELVNRLDLDAALRNGEEALAAAARGGGEMLAARAMDGLKLVAFVLGDFARLRSLGDWLEDVLGRHDDRWYLMFTMAETSFAWAAAGDWAGAERRLAEARRLNAELGDRANAAYPLTLAAELERTRGRYGDAVTLARQAVAAAREGRNIQWIAWSCANLGAILADLGAYAESLEHLDEGRQAAERGLRIQLLRIRALQAAVHTAAGDGDTAGAHLDAAAELLAQVRTPAGSSFLYGLDAYLAVAGVRRARGDSGAATELLAPLLPAAEAAGWAAGVARVTLALGECAAASGDGGRAATLLGRAAEVAATSGIPMVGWQAHAALAGLCDRSGDAPSAASHRRRARAVVDDVSATIVDTSLRRSFEAAAAASLEDPTC